MKTLNYNKTPITWSNFNNIKICSEVNITDSFIHSLGPEKAEQLIRKQLAQEIAKQLIEEDLMKIETNSNLTTMTRTVRATIRVIQE